MVLLVDDTLVIEQITTPGYEKVLRVTDASSGLDAIISIHSTRLGPALGGIRIYPYASFDDALTDVLRLSKGMTYKAALAECGWGGGKSVIIADPKTQKTEELLLAFGAAVNKLAGEYIAAEDVGCTPEDMQVISRATPYVVGLHHEKSSGNPAPYTAWGTYRAIQAVLKKIYGSDDVHGRIIAIQGLGNVGSRLAEFLFWSGAHLILSDIDEHKAQAICDKLGAQFCPNSLIMEQPCDVFAPCALGGILNSDTIQNLRCRAVAGSANNQLLHDSDADSLKKMGILYAIDYITNAGGLINVTEELAPGGYNPSTARDKVHHLYDQLLVIFDIAERNECSTNSAANSLADYRILYGVGRRTEPVIFPFATIQ